jgi:hypothetical protein
MEDRMVAAPDSMISFRLLALRIATRVSCFALFATIIHCYSFSQVRITHLPITPGGVDARASLPAQSSWTRGCPLSAWTESPAYFKAVSPEELIAVSAKRCYRLHRDSARMEVLFEIPAGAKYIDSFWKDRNLGIIAYAPDSAKDSTLCFAFTRDAGWNWDTIAVWQPHIATLGPGNHRVCITDSLHAWVASEADGLVQVDPVHRRWKLADPTVSNSRTVLFADSLHGWYIGSGLKRTTDGGSTWHASLSMNGMQLAAPDTMVIFAIDGDTLRNSTDGGVSWDHVQPQYPGSVSIYDAISAENVWLYLNDPYTSRSGLVSSRPGGIWNRLETPVNVRIISMYGQDDGWLVAGNEPYFTRNGGVIPLDSYVYDFTTVESPRICVTWYNGSLERWLYSIVEYLSPGMMDWAVCDTVQYPAITYWDENPVPRVPRQYRIRTRFATLPEIVQTSDTISVDQPRCIDMLPYIVPPRNHTLRYYVEHHYFWGGIGANINDTSTVNMIRTWTDETAEMIHHHFTETVFCKDGSTQIRDREFLEDKGKDRLLYTDFLVRYYVGWFNYSNGYYESSLWSSDTIMKRVPRPIPRFLPVELRHAIAPPDSLNMSAGKHGDFPSWWMWTYHRDIGLTETQGRYQPVQSVEWWKVLLIESIVPVEPDATLGSSAHLDQNFPNPFHRSTRIDVSLPVAGHLSLRVYDAMGRMVRCLHEGDASPGRHGFVFDRSGLPAGLYFYTMLAGGGIETRKMIVLE